MAINERLVHTASAAADSVTSEAEQGLILHLDANDVDSYDGDGSVWYDISEHDVTIPLSSDDSDNLKIHYNPSDSNSYSGTGTTLTNLAGSSLDATVVASRFDIDNGGFFDISTDGEQSIVIPSGHPLNGEFTLEFWFKFQSTPVQGNRFIYDLGETKLQFFFYQPHGWRFFQAGGQETGYYASGSIEVGKWQHKVITFSSSGSFKAYIDGELVKSKTWSRATTSLGAFDFGTTDITADKPKCDIGAIRMYDKVLSASEVGQNYRHGRDYIYTDLIPDKDNFVAGSIETTNLELDLDANDYSGSGNWLDGTSNNNDGTITGATYVNDGSSDYFDFERDSSHTVTIADSSSLDISTNITLEAWINEESVANYGRLFWKNAAYHLYRGTNGWTFLLGSAHYLNHNSDIPSTGTWYHIAATYDGSNQKLYINGELVDTEAMTGSIPTNNNSLYIGGIDSARFFDGKIGQARIYSSALTLTQIKSNYDATKVYVQPSLEIHYDPANTNSYSGTGTTLTDLAGNNNGDLLGGIENSYDEELGNWFDITGSGDGITTSSPVSINPNTDGMTVEMWFKIDSNTQNYLFSFDGTDTTYMGVSYRSNVNQVWWFYRIGASANDILYSSTISLNTWYHLVVTTDGSTGQFYLNGQLVDSSTSAPYSKSYNEDLHFGNMYDLAQNNNTQIGQIRFYKGGLTADEVMQNYLFTKKNYPNGQNGSIHGNVSWNTNYFDFPASDGDAVRLPNESFQLETITVSAWINPDSLSSYGSFFENYEYSGGSKGLIFNHFGNGKLRFRGYNGDPPTADISSTNIVISTNTWQHVAGVYSAGNVGKLYVNGVEVSSYSSQTTGSVGFLSSGHETTIGAIRHSLTTGDSEGEFDGKIGSVKIYSKALTGDELLADYNATKSTYGL